LEVAAQALKSAEIYWLSTVRPDGAPHVTPLIGICSDRRFDFCTGADERKGRNLAANSKRVVTTGNNEISEGLNIVVESRAVRLRDEARLQRLAVAYAAKYEGWHFEVKDGAFQGEGGEALVFEVDPVKMFAFGKGRTFSQTRYHFRPRPF
jgi:hypothetical protein